MRSLSCLKFLAPTSACVNSRRRSWQRRWHASQSAPAAPPGRPGPRGPGGRVNCRPFARRWWSALGSCRSARPCGGRLQHSHASAGVLDRRPPAHQPGSRAPLSAWRHSRTALGHGRSFRGRSDATGLHRAGCRRGHRATCGEVVLLRAMAAALAAAGTTRVLSELLQEQNQIGLPWGQ